jgi:beta-phosphoglucomutase family hydrolase
MENNRTCAVLWDMDGVIVDTGEYHYRAWEELMAKEGIPFNRDMFRRTFGMNNVGVLTTVLGENASPEEIKRLDDGKEEIFRRILRGNVQALPGVKPLLEQLRSLGYRQAIASSAPWPNIELIMEETGVESYFDAIVSAANMPGKPDPTVFLEAARRVGALPQNCTVVEDAIAGVEAAHRAGMRCLAVTTTNPREKLAKADLVLDSMEELPQDYFPGPL